MVKMTQVAMAVFVTLITGNLGSGVSAPSGKFEFTQKTSVASSKILVTSGPVQKSCCPARPSCCGHIVVPIRTLQKQHGVVKLSELGVCFSPLRKGVALEDLTLEISSRGKMVFQSESCKDCKQDFPSVIAGKDSREGYQFILDGTALQAADKFFLPENVMSVRVKYSGGDGGPGTLFLIKADTGSRTK